MPVYTSAATTDGQTTVPEAVRTALGLQVGTMLVWELTPNADGTQLHTVRSILELDQLAGCLQSDVPFIGISEEKLAAQRASAESAALSTSGYSPAL